MGRPIAITALPVSPDEDRHRRFVLYTSMMAVRVGCVLGCLFTTGLWQLLCLAGAVLLPYFAVTMANVARSVREEPERPGPRELDG